MPYYPAFLDLKGRKCVVVGGGRVAERKANSLVKAGGDVVVVSPALTAGLLRKKQKGSIRHVCRAYRGGDLKGAFLAFSATDSGEENERVANEARRRGIPVNVADKPALCSFIIPSVVNRGPLVIAISTSGASPAMAKAIRLELESLYGPPFGRYLKRLADLRARAIREMPPAERRKLLGKMASGDIIKTLRKGKKPEAPIF